MVSRTKLLVQIWLAAFLGVSGSIFGAEVFLGFRTQAQANAMPSAGSVEISMATRHPAPTITLERSNGATAEPAAMAARTIPLARPCCDGLIHRATPCAAAGNVGASPTPKRKRSAKSDVSIPPTEALKGPHPNPAINVVMITHQKAAHPKTRRAPQRSAAAPLG